MSKERRRQVAVIGAGASGCMAAVAAARAGSTVYLIDKNEKTGKKIYATGNGKCNLTNLFMSADCYYAGGSDSGRERVLSLIERFSQKDLIRFFRELGVPVHDREGYVYPRTDQAGTVVRAFEKCFRALGITVLTDCRVQKIEKEPVSGRENSFRFRIICRQEMPEEDFGKENKKTGKKQGKTKRRSVPAVIPDCDAVILCTGGMAGPSFGCSGDGYGFARSFSHHVTPLFPALTQLVCDSPWLKRSAGARCRASVQLVRGNGQVVPDSLETGELQMTDYGISGIPVFQISGLAGRLLAEGEKLSARIDFLPEFSQEQFSTEKENRLREDRSQMLSDVLLGLAHRKIIDLVLASEGLQAEMKARRLDDAALDALLEKFRSFDLRVRGTRSFDSAQTTSGGVPLEEVTDSFESVFCPGLYLAGELLDVDGRCGGYNLQWAMTSGFLAGKAASEDPS